MSARPQASPSDPYAPPPLADSGVEAARSLAEAARPLHRALSICDRLFAEHLDAAAQSFGAEALGLLDLPPISGGQVEPAQLRVTGPLLWARELELAGLLPVTEALAEGLVRGTVIEPLGEAIHAFLRFWRGREERFSPEERRAVFSRLFGGAGSVEANEGFDSQFGALVGALSAYGRDGVSGGSAHHLARIDQAARTLAAELSARSAGATAFAARDIVAQIREALALLRHPDVVRAFGGGDVWTILRRIAPRVLGRSLSPQIHLARAGAGLGVLRWLAESAPQLGSGQLRLARDAAVVQDAERWLATTGGV